MSDPFYLVVAAVFGAIIGSFLNALIYRLPLRHERKFGKRSVCPYCGASIPAYLNIPILAWLWLRGKAACCGAKIHWRYPLVEAITAVMFFVLAKYPPSGIGLTVDTISFDTLMPSLLHGFFVANLIACTFIDFDHRILPNPLTYSLMIVGILGAWLVPGLAGELPRGVDPSVGSLMISALGFGVGWGVTWGVRVLSSSVFRKEAMGFGDVKLMGGVGAFLGWDGALLTFFLGCVSGAVFGVVSKIVTKDSEIAFGPFLVLGALFTLFWRAPIVEFLTVTWPEWQRENANSPLALGAVAAISLLLLIVLVRRGRAS